MADAAGSGSRSRSQQLQELQSLTGPQQMETHRLAKQLASARHPVRMSSYCHDLLLYYLHTGPGLLPISVVISQHISFEVGLGAWVDDQ
jgi:hypothetical protein